MKKLLKPKDILLLGLAGIGDIMEETKDPLHLVSSAYENMYGFVPRRYARNNFLKMVGRGLKTGDIERVVKNEKVYLRLTSAGHKKVKRDFPIASLTKEWNKRWVIVIFDIEEKSRVIRDSLRTKLRNIGFGMLQESVWITPLPIEEDMRELIDSLGLSVNVFVMEVSHLIFGDPKELARKVWNLDKLEGEYIGIKKETEKVNQLLATHNDRDKKREGKIALRVKTSPHLYRLKRKKRALMNKLINFTVYLPPLPKELLPKSFREENLHYHTLTRSVTW
jgi:phenylacetic acid degradation operon negative regulatory protein